VGRRPVVREAILRSLQNSRTALRFGEIREKVEGFLNKKVTDKSIAENLAYLLEVGLVEKCLNSPAYRPAYRLANNYYRLQSISTLQKLLQTENLDFYAEPEDEEDPPLIAFFQEHKEEKNVIHFSSEHILSWRDPSKIFASRMLEAMNDYPTYVKDGITKLLAFAYWCGVKSKIEKYAFKPLPEVIESSRKFAQKCLSKAEGEWQDPKRVEAEKALIEILNLCERLISKQNLKEFLIFLQENTPKVKILQGEIVKNLGHWLMGGEKIWDSFLDFHSVVITGLYAAGLISNERRRGSKNFRKRFFFAYSSVWNKFLKEILVACEEFRDVKGERGDIIPKLKGYAQYLKNLEELPLKSKVIITYMWGFSEVFSMSDKSFLPLFEEWLTALNEGRIDHHSWIFENIGEVERACRAVKMGKAPRDVIIDPSSGMWTLRDIYLYHPRGKDYDFWVEILSALRGRAKQEEGF